MVVFPAMTIEAHCSPEIPVSCSIFFNSSRKLSTVACLILFQLFGIVFPVKDSCEDILSIGDLIIKHRLFPKNLSCIHIYQFPSQSRAPQICAESIMFSSGIPWFYICQFPVFSVPYKERCDLQSAWLQRG